MGNDKALQLKISLVHSKPPIWRRVLVHESLTLADLHVVIQIVMGWENSHLHDFEMGSERFTEFEEDVQSGARDSTTVTLRGLGLNRKGRTVTYNYDFGDGWRHKVFVESSRPAEDSPMLPVCMTGRRACPPEDSGGVHGYEDLLEAVSDPTHPDHDELSEWLDPDFDPEAFDVDRVNRDLRRVFSEGDGPPVN
ncbi:MAG: plasmid pRiA4b ORF-3 family protein [Thermoanaerobaculales bacterium]